MRCNTPRHERRSDVERAKHDEHDAHNRGERHKGAARIDQRDDACHDVDAAEQRVGDLPDARHGRHACELECSSRERTHREQNRDRADAEVVERKRMTAKRNQPRPLTRNSHQYRPTPTTARSPLLMLIERTSLRVWTSVLPVHPGTRPFPCSPALAWVAGNPLAQRRVACALRPIVRRPGMYSTASPRPLGCGYRFDYYENSGHRAGDAAAAIEEEVRRHLDGEPFHMRFGNAYDRLARGTRDAP
jgi:hypothetical protein